MYYLCCELNDVCLRACISACMCVSECAYYVKRASNYASVNILGNVFFNFKLGLKMMIV